MAKRIIHLAVKVGEVLNHDPETNEYIRLYFLPDYNVSVAETMIPGVYVKPDRPWSPDAEQALD